jgi:hypothetical protein
LSASSTDLNLQEAVPPGNLYSPAHTSNHSRASQQTAPSIGIFSQELHQNIRSCREPVNGSMTRRPVGENRRVTRDQPSRERYLVRHDYGMGALWWWITAASAAEITTTFAEVEVIDDPTTVRAVESWSLDQLGIADAISGPLAELYSKRKQQRQDPAFGKLLGKSRAYLRLI